MWFDWFGLHITTTVKQNQFRPALRFSAIILLTNFATGLLYLGLSSSTILPRSPKPNNPGLFTEVNRWYLLRPGSNRTNRHPSFFKTLNFVLSSIPLKGGCYSDAFACIVEHKESVTLPSTIVSGDLVLPNLSLLSLDSFTEFTKIWIKHSSRGKCSSLSSPLLLLIYVLLLFCVFLVLIFVSPGGFLFALWFVN